MEKFYKLMDWLDIGQALDYLQRLTTTPFTEAQLLQLCEAGQCGAFARIGEVEGVKKGPFGYGFPPHLAESDDSGCYSNVTNVAEMNATPGVKCVGVQRVLNANQLLLAGTAQDVQLELFGRIVVPQGFTTKPEYATWRAFIPMLSCTPLFKPAEILSLADKMNGEAKQSSDSTAALEDLSKQLEQERTARKQAEADAESAKSESEHWWQISERERACRESTQAEADRLRQELTCEGEKPLDRRERASLERLLYVVAKDAGYQLIAPYSDEIAIQQAAASIGAKVPMGKGAIVKYLEAAIARAEQDRQE
jgi:hypothetical protein